MTNKDTPIKLKMETEVYLYPMIAEQKETGELLSYQADHVINSGIKRNYNSRKLKKSLS